MTPPALVPPPAAVVIVAEPATIRGGVPLYPGVAWATGGPIVIDAPPGVYTVWVYGPAPKKLAPVRERLQPVTVEVLPTRTPLEQAIDAELESIRTLGLEIQERYARLVRLVEARDAGETEVPE